MLGRILHLQRLSTEDGPGIRTTVFFKGCPLACLWCHNPESISSQSQVQWVETRCIRCGCCVETCPNDALTLNGDGWQRNEHRCQLCWECLEECPGGAIERLGVEISVEELVKELLKDRVYFEKSGGGVTLSGGEPTLQPEFADSLLQRLHEDGIHTALDTCGLCSKSTLELLLPYTDLVLYDLKEINSAKHKLFTGHSNELILENLRFITTRFPGKPIWVRTPLIPGATADCENLGGLGNIIASMDEAVQRWELLAFNNLCRDKYCRLGLEWAYSQTTLMTKAELAELDACAKNSGVNPDIVFTTGAHMMEPQMNADERR